MFQRIPNLSKSEPRSLSAGKNPGVTLSTEYPAKNRIGSRRVISSPVQQLPSPTPPCVRIGTREVPIRLGYQARKEERSRWLACRELLVPLGNGCSVRIAHSDALRPTAHTPSGHVAFAPVHPAPAVFRLAHPPVAFAAARRQMHFAREHSQGQRITTTRAWLLVFYNKRYEKHNLGNFRRNGIDVRTAHESRISLHHIYCKTSTGCLERFDREKDHRSILHGPGAYFRTEESW